MPTNAALPPGVNSEFASTTRVDTFDTFGCNVIKGAPRTPDKLTPDVIVERRGAESVDIRMADGKKVKFWKFNDLRAANLSADAIAFPSAMMRFREGQTVHSRLHTAKGAHTIHHHGMNPTTLNDGVGHLSMEINDVYDYQFRPSQAGTYFYHCHVNTVLHFEMGMYGLLIVDPPEGPGRMFRNGPKYDVEAFWVPDDVDPRWRNLDHAAGLCGTDVGLNRFNPKYFMLTGVPSHQTQTNAKTKIRAKVGQTILIRHLNASYSVCRLKIDGLQSTLWSADGRPYGVPSRPWVNPIPFAAGEWIETVSAQRRELLVVPDRVGTFTATIEFRDWITGNIQDNGRGVVNTVIEVTS